MVYNPNSTWSSAAAEAVQAPVFFLRIEGVGVDYSTHDVKNAGTTKVVCAEPPRGGAHSVDPLDGAYSQSPVEVELLDVDGEITRLIATEGDNARTETLVNRKATLYGGYRHMDEADYPAIFTGRVSGVEMNGDATGYVLRMVSLLYLLDADIMTGATESSSTTIVGNPCNVYYSILRGVFSTTGDFSLSSVSADTSSSSAPTGIGLGADVVDTASIADARDRYYPDDEIKVVFKGEVNAKTHLADELFRVFQAFPSVTGDGKIGLRFLYPPLPPQQPAELRDDTHILDISAWRRRYDLHLNKFRFYCEPDASKGDGTFSVTLYSDDLSEDTQDRSDSGETITYQVQSRWLSNQHDGTVLAEELAMRTRIRYLKTPAEIPVRVNMTARNIEQGEVVAVTLRGVPDLLRGTRDIEGQLMMVEAVEPDFGAGHLTLKLSDAAYHKQGVITPSTASDYTSETTVNQSVFAFVSDASDSRMSNDDPGVYLA
jgi:hypothetical protein